MQLQSPLHTWKMKHKKALKEKQKKKRKRGKIYSLYSSRPRSLNHYSDFAFLIMPHQTVINISMHCQFPVADLMFY